ncbi:hypothetical protein PILCRDRAFT_491 [Piloderma croceum F 1598]|uniref:Uncharacterized protein n=1 Tax=Piloderma croceum (strain F 1598) TaxID=765440 RepID=A0A0C3G8A3_PILCF|nr:hypothetical protein PILCRDRAFT_491 [Piloderma croceum F 1598]
MGKRLVHHNDPDIIDQSRSDMGGLFTEVSDLSRKRRADLIVICSPDILLKEYKCTYEQEKTELSNVKAMSPASSISM